MSVKHFGVKIFDATHFPRKQASYLPFGHDSIRYAKAWIFPHIRQVKIKWIQQPVIWCSPRLKFKGTELQAQKTTQKFPKAEDKQLIDLTNISTSTASRLISKSDDCTNDINQLVTMSILNKNSNLQNGWYSQENQQYSVYSHNLDICTICHLHVGVV